jgi:outer membrane protein assembly factor BamB/tRNA A-37 threonylcarbamoyl transferase component Bud32
MLNSLKSNKSENLSLPKGTRLANRYLIQETISVSAKSTIYQARDLHFPNVVKLVAVKEMVNPAPDSQDRETKVKNFERQVNLLATLSHPSIPRVFDYFTHERQSYLVLEYIQGETLEKILNNSPGFFPQEQVVQWAIGLCEVLQYLHSHQPEPVILGDLNPTNIMLDQHSNLMLVDFGIANVFLDDQDESQTAMPGYSPPERFQGEVTAQVDVYSLGATMHHLLSGQDPRQQPPFSFTERPIREVNPSISPQLEAIITTAVQHQPSDRYQSADELKSALLEMIGRSDSRQLSPQFHSVIPVAEDAIQPRWTFTCADEIRGSAACDRGIVYVGSYDNHLYALNIETGKMLWKYQTDGGIVSRPAILNDSVFIGSEDSRLHVVSRRTGSLQWTYYTKGPVRSSPFPAHGHIFIGSDDWAIHAINISGGRGIWQIETSAEVRSTPFVAQDAVYAGNESGEFYCLDFRGGIKWRYKTKRAITSSPTITDGLVLFCSLDSHLYALDTKSGYLVWRFKMDRGSISSPCVADGLIFTGSIDGNIYCVNLNSAKEVWRFQTEHQITGSPIIVGDRLYCGSVDGNLYCLDHQTGQLHWKFKTNNPITATPAAQNGMIFIGSTDKQFYALPAGPQG